MKPGTFAEVASRLEAMECEVNDAESLLTDIQYPASTSLNVHFTYDGYGRRSSMSDGSGSRSYSYGNLDETVSIITTYTGLSGKTISYTYYPDGSRQTMTTPAGTFSYSYDAGGRPASMTNPFSETTSWAYQNNNWLSTQTLANGAVATYTNNALGQVTELLNQIGSTTISDFSSIAYDGVGNRSSVTATIPSATSLSGITGYTYDSKDQITQETSTRNDGFTDNFGYDSAGNPTSFKGITKSYNSNNQQTGTGFSHDGNGNPTNYGGTTLTFDPENRMTAYGSALTAGYSGAGLRAWKQNATGRTYFLYDGIAPVVELDSSGSVTATNTFGASGLVSRREGSTSVFYSFDSEGNVAHRTDDTGAVLSNHLFSAHGSILNGTLSDPFGYKAQVGYYTDNETGLQLLTHRYYDQSTGRFITRDPMGFSGGANLYAYVANNALNFIDPLGLTRLEFRIDTGTLIVITNEGFHYYTHATSGFGSAVNDPRRTSEKNIGAIPPGQYRIDMKDFTDPGYFGDLLRNMRGDWGDWRVPIKPEPWNKASGRDGFFLHGGSIAGSAGCIDIGGGIHGDSFSDFVRDELRRDPDGIIEVTVYPANSLAGKKRQKR